MRSKQPDAREKRKRKRTKKTFPRFFRADVRNQLMPADQTSGDVCAHVAEFRDRDQIQTIKLAGDYTGRGTRRDVNNFRDEIVEPKDIEQTEQRVSHRAQRFVIAQAVEHLPRENRQQKKEQDGDFKIVGARQAVTREVVKAPDEHDHAANHAGEFEIRQSLVIEHGVKFPERDEAEDADQSPERHLITRKSDEECDRPEGDRTHESKNKNGAWRGRFQFGPLDR